MLDALADGELAGDELARAQEHLAACAPCAPCTTSALAASLLKGATARAGERYAAPPELQARLAKLVAGAESAPEEPRRGWGFGSFGLALAALLLLYAGLFLLPHRAGRDLVAAADYSALVTEIGDQHIAMLAGGAPPEVVSSDRHTVKPWFQGKIPFSFNLPQDLPADTTLDGADLTYLRDQPAAQLLYSVGRHRVSVFVRARAAGADAELPAQDYQGFHTAGFRAGNLEVLAVSDVDAARLADLVARMKGAQAQLAK
jgi:anti-sigma factor RsiW